MRPLASRMVHVVDSLSPLQSLISRRWRPQWVCASCQSRRPQRRGLATHPQSSDNLEKPYYVTTPIFYVNAEPHVGHMYTMILTDVLKRWQVLKGRRAVLCTGTDEHGMKIQQAALKAGIDPKPFCDRGAGIFRDLASQINISNDIFIRTTDQKHREAVEYAWLMLQERDYIYESKHEGWYSVSDETFYPEKQVHLIIDPPTGRKMMASIETGKEVEWTSERNYHFRLSAFRERLLSFYKDNPSFIVPMTRMNDVVDQVTSGLEDLSISRPTERLNWGIRVPSDQSQTIYVWLDALLNYASAVGFPFTPHATSRGWPADVHVIGKDIVRFHCIYWPAFLMALDLPLPKQVLTHAHWTLGRQKMAKSTGNVVNPFYALDRFGVDALRWYLVHDGGIADDADYDNNFIAEKYKKGLSGGLGNLASRILKGKHWNVSQAVKEYAALEQCEDPTALFSGQATPDDADFFRALRLLPEEVDRHMLELHPNRALQAIMQAVYRANAYLTLTAPWALGSGLAAAPHDLAADQPIEGLGMTRSQAEARIARVIFLEMEALRLAGILLQPFIPASAARLLDMLGVKAERRSWEYRVAGTDDSYGAPVEAHDRSGKVVLFPALTTEN